MYSYIRRIIIILITHTYIILIIILIIIITFNTHTHTRSEDYDHDAWFSAYTPKEEDGCYIDDISTAITGTYGLYAYRL
jgi:hypothetical protein